MGIDFLAIGDFATDTFIKLREAKIECDSKGESCTVSFAWGAKITYDFASVVYGCGNAGNAVISAARLGLSAAILSTVGDDHNSDRSIKTFKENGVSTRLITQLKGTPSNHHYALWYGSDRTIFRRHNPYPPYKIPLGRNPGRFVYLSSIGDESGQSHAAVLKWLAKYPKTKLVFQPGRELGLSKEIITPIFKASYLCICNKQEVEQVLGLGPDQEIKKLLTDFKALGPEVVVITNGPKGAYAYDGTEMLRVPMYPDQKPPYERTGAGDAFSSTLTAALALGKPLREALLWGPVNAMMKVQHVGGHEGLLTRSELEELLTKAPPEYRIEKL